MKRFNHIVLPIALLALSPMAFAQGQNGGNAGGGLDDPPTIEDIKNSDALNPEALEIQPAEIEALYPVVQPVPNPQPIPNINVGLPSDLMSAWLAPNHGIQYTNLNYTGGNTQSRVYTATEQVGQFFNNSGIVLTTGNANFANTNTSTGSTGITGTGGSAYVSQISGQFTYDSNALRFNFTTDAGLNAVSTKFVFASEEYPEWTGIFKDGFAFVVDGVNYAKFNPNNFVTLNDLPTSYADVGSGDNIFLNNNINSIAPFEFDGYTNTLTATGFLDPNKSVHTLEVVIADSGDQLWDSAVFLSGLQATKSNLAASLFSSPVPEPDSYAMMFAGIALMAFRVSRRKI